MNVKMKIAIASAGFLSLLIVLAGCSGHSSGVELVTPTVEELTVLTPEGNGAVTLVMRPWDRPLTSEDTEYYIERTRDALNGTQYAPEGPRAIASAVIPEGSRQVAFVFAVFTDSPESPYYWNLSVEDPTAEHINVAVERVYQQAQQAFIEELAGCSWNSLSR